MRYFIKAKYTKRWKGKDGKWHYEYAKQQYGKGKKPSVKPKSKPKPKSKTGLKPDRKSEMYRRGFDDGSIKFSYVPDFETKQDAVDWSVGLSEGKRSIESKKAKK